MDERTRNFAIIGGVVLLLIGLGWFLVGRNEPPEPKIGPGQSLHNPFGTAAPGGPAGAQPGGGRVPAAGTVDPKMGFGPSRAGPFKKQ